MWIHSKTLAAALAVAFVFDATTAAVFRVKEAPNGLVYAVPKVDDTQDNVAREVEQRQVAPTTVVGDPVLASGGPIKPLPIGNTSIPIGSPSPIINPMPTFAPTPIVIAPPPVGTPSSFIVEPNVTSTSGLIVSPEPLSIALPAKANGTIVAPLPGHTTPGPITYTVITPYPSASPIAITSMSQVVPTYVPQLTLCAPGLTPSISGIEYSSPQNTATGGCSTKYSKSLTTVCATTLYGLGTSVPITDCEQQVTFSSEYGYVLSAPGNAPGTPVIQTLTTAYIAPWQDLTEGVTPTDVTQRVCSDVVAHTSERQCVDIFETWIPTTVTVTSTLTSFVDLTTTIHGPSVLYIETYSAEITEKLTTLIFTSTMLLEYSTEAISTVRQTLPTALPTVLPTLSTGWNTTHAHSSEPQTTTSTVVVTLTSTVYLAATQIQTVQSAASSYKPVL